MLSVTLRVLWGSEFRVLSMYSRDGIYLTKILRISVQLRDVIACHALGSVLGPAHM